MISCRIRLRMDSKDPNVFLNSITDMNRDMFSVKKNERNPQGGKERFEADMVLNQGVLKQNRDAEQSKMIVGLQSENKTLKTKINMVIEKDEEIYRLQCENTLLQKDNAEIKATTVTDYTLKNDNDRLLLEKADLDLEIQGLREQVTDRDSEILQLKQTIVAMAKATPKVPIQAPIQTAVQSTMPLVPGLVLVNVQNLKSSVALRKQHSCESKIDGLLQKHRIADNQYVTKDALSQLVQEALL
jgi:hypothetical protein